MNTPLAKRALAGQDWRRNPVTGAQILVPACIALMFVFWATGRGTDVMKPIALPSLGGMAVSVITMFIVPCLFSAIKEWKWKRGQRGAAIKTG